MWPARRLALLAAFLVLAALLTVKGVVPSLMDARGDFANYYTASKILAEGGPLENAYLDFPWFQKEIDRHGIEGQVGGFIPHPPPTALALLPLAPLDALTAKRIWTAVNVLLLAVCILLLAKLSGLDWIVAGLVLLGSGAALINQFLFGQLYLLLLCSILAALHWRQRGRPFVAGVCLGCLIPLKYIGGLWLLYFCWKRQWRLVAGAALSVTAVLALTLWLAGLQPLLVFAEQVLPRHLAGEIQDPFSIRLQSWNSLFRRLFLPERTLNPDPPIDQPALFFLSKNLVFWGLAAFSVVVLARVSPGGPKRRELFQTGWIPVAALLLSPGGATYHFLLLTISAVFFFKIFQELGRGAEAVATALLFVGVNLPHYLWLEPLATGWLTPIAYTRLWTLLVFFLWIPWAFRDRIRWPAPSAPVAAALVAGILLASWAEHRRYQRSVERDDGARWLKVAGPEFDRELGLLLAEPDLGRDRLVFSYCALFENQYAVFAADGARWTAPTGFNTYGPDLFRDDASLLVETVRNGRDEIWLGTSRRGRLLFAASGADPSWGPDGRSFALTRDGRVFIHRLEAPEASPRPLPTSPNCYDVAYSPMGTHLAYCIKTGQGTALALFDLKKGEERIILASKTRIAEPDWSLDQRALVFSREVAGNRDIWALRLQGDEAPIRLTEHPGRDNDPVWDSPRDRIVFTSDRGRGLEFTTLFWIPIPESLK